MAFTVIILVIIIFLFYKWSTSTFDFFEKRGIKSASRVPFFGSLLDVLLLRRSFTGLLKYQYFQFPDEKVFGMFELRRPAWVIRDPELIKQISIKEFDGFVNHRWKWPETSGVFDKSIFFLADQTWQDLRGALNFGLTPSKIRKMIPLIADSTQKALDCCLPEASEGKKEVDEPNKGAIIEIDDFCSRLTSNLIAKIAYGIDDNSIINRNSIFYKMTVAFNPLMSVSSFKFFIHSSYPRLLQYLGVEIFFQKTGKFFEHLLVDSMRIREKTGIICHDLVDYYLNSRKGKLTFKPEKNSDNTEITSMKQAYTDDEFASLSISFLMGATSTYAVHLFLMIYELMANPDVQEKLIAEIDSVRGAETDPDTLTDEMLQKCTYMDMVISESLRKWNSAYATDRVCTKTCVLDCGDKKIEIMPGDTVVFPFGAMQNDPKYFPNPEKFDPERFNEKNKQHITPGTFIPFGSGPRICVAYKFVLMQSKVILFYMFSRFSLKACEKTEFPIKFAERGLTIRTINGCWVRFEPRKKTN